MGVLAAGVVLAGCRIEATVGRGGMGVVYRARQVALDRDVALKVIAPEHVEDPDARERFLTEARAAAAVEHPHVVPVYGAGIEHGQAYLVMRYVPGQDVRALVHGGGPLDPDRAGAIAMDLGGALDAIHHAGYVHRDVKPANVLIEPGGHVLLSDFGLAKHALASSGPTRSDHWVGTVDYAAPEQIRGEHVDARTDVYALGAVLYFMLTGHVPFERDGDAAKLWAHLADDPPPPSTLRPELPARFDRVVQRALAKEPGDRQPSAGDLGRAALGIASEPERTIARGEAAPADKASTVATPRAEAAVTTVPRKRPGRLALGGAAAVLLAAAAVAVFELAGGGGRPREGAPGPRQARTPAPAAPAGPVVGDTIENVGSEPRDVAVAGGDVWVLSQKRGRVARLDARTGRRHGVQPRIGEGGWSIAADDDMLWVAHPSEGTVQRIDAASGRVTTSITPPVTPVDVAPARLGLWVAGRATRVPLRGQAPENPDMLLRYDRSGRLLDTVEIPRGIRDVAVGGRSVWVSLLDASRVLQLSADGRHVRRRIGLQDKANHMTYGAGYLWASLPEHDAVSRIDPDTGDDVTTGVSAKPAELAVAEDRVFVASNTDHQVDVLDTETGLLAGDALPVAPNPYGVAAGAGHVWVTSHGDVVTRIDP